MLLEVPPGFDLGALLAFSFATLVGDDVGGALGKKPLVG
jgi:hypothetical protein